MLPTATIVFREVLEIALVLGIVMAATRGVPGRIKIALAGLGLGLCGAAIIAFFTDSISQAMEGVGQELSNATIIFIAVALLSWTVIWMKRHGRALAQNISAMGRDVISGDKSIYVLVGVIAVATLREGAETVLFSYSMLVSGAFSFSQIMMGGVLGAMGGALVGFALYFGLLRAAQSHLFSVTSWLLILLTAGMAAQGASFLIAAGVLPELHPQLWDSSGIISGHSMLGQTLGVLVGYTPRPTGMELLFYSAILFGVGGLYKIVGTEGKTSRSTSPSGTHNIHASEA